MQDIAIATGGQFIAEDVGLKLEDGDLSVLGQAKQVIITKDDTIILNGNGARNDIEERASFIREAIDNSTSDYEKEKLQEIARKYSQRIARKDRQQG